MTTQHTTPITLARGEIAELAETPLGDIAGVSNTTLWTDGVSATGILEVDAGHRLGSHRHREHCHHMWVLSGHADILGRRLGPGSYAYVPSDVEHDIDATNTEGVTVFYSYTLPADALSPADR